MKGFRSATKQKAGEVSVNPVERCKATQWGPEWSPGAKAFNAV